MPEIGLGLSQADREVRLGWRLTRAAPGGIAFELGAEARRLDRRDGGEGPDHEIGLGWRLEGAGAGVLGFETRIEASRRDPANDNEDPDQGVGLQVTARW